MLLFTQEAGHPPNVVVYTTLLKGYATVGDVATALRLLSSMQQQRPPVPPDVRSINTFLRGCVRVGDLAAAWNVFQQLKAKWKVILTAPVNTSAKRYTCTFPRQLSRGLRRCRPSHFLLFPCQSHSSGSKRISRLWDCSVPPPGWRSAARH